MRKTKLKMNKPIYLGLAILDISKTLMYEVWYDYLKPKFDNNIGLCYMDTDSCIFHVETEDFHKDISNDVENRFDTSAYSNDLNRPLPIAKNKKVLGMMKDELCGKIMAKFAALRAKTYSYLDYEGKDYFEYILKKHSESVDNPSIKIYVKKNENKVTFKIKNGYYLELLTPETMKLFASAESKITKVKNGENVPHLEINFN